MTRCEHVSCKRKLLITDFPCKCGGRYCIEHRLPEVHMCPSIDKEREKHKKYLQEKLIDAKFNKIEKL